jgi:hypothetical protein
MTPEERITRNLSQLKLLVEADVKEAISAAYEDAARIADLEAEQCEGLDTPSRITAQSIAAAIRAKAG